MMIEKTANVTISREFFDDLIRYFSYYKYSYVDMLGCQTWCQEIENAVWEYANLEVAKNGELIKPTKEEMQKLNEKIQEHIADKLIAVGNRHKYRVGKFDSGKWKKK